MKNKSNKSSYIFLLFLGLFLLFVFLKDEYKQSQAEFDKDLQTKMLNQYIKTSNTQKEQWSNGAVKQIFELDEKNQKEGHALVFYIDGVLKEKALYEQGILKQLEAFGKDGVLLHEIVCKDSQYCTQTSFHPNGNKDFMVDLKYRTPNANPVYHGKWTQYHYDKGYITSITTFQDGKEHGLNQTFRKDGSLWSEVNYMNGKREGKETVYNPDGSVFGEVFYKNDKEIQKKVAQDTTCFTKGNHFANQGKLDEALVWYEKGIESNITNCIINAAAIYMDTKPEYAATLLHKALVLEPYDSFIHYNLGIYYYNLGVNKTIEQREATDTKAKYHFLFAHLLGEKDATYYVKGFYTLKKEHGFVKDVLKEKQFDKKLIETRIEKFAKESMKGFFTTVKEDKVVLYGKLNTLNAKEFGKYIQLLQHALYLDIPNDVASKTEDSLNKSKSSFSDGVLLHRFLLDENQEFTYSVEVIK